MGADTGSEEPRRGRAGRHRRIGSALIERRDHLPPRRSRGLPFPAPSPSALVGLAVLVLIAIGVVHLSGTGSAIPPALAPTTQGEEIVDGPTGAAEDPATSGSATDAGEDPAPGAGEDSSPGEDSAPGERSASAEIVVHVSGAVAAPGVVRLPGGARVDDALRAAGGATDEADLSAVNLARAVVDGEQIHVPVPGEDPRPVPGADGSPGAPGSGDPAGSSGVAPAGEGTLIDLNTASAVELEELPGVGPSIAARIVEHREKNGPFSSVEGLLEVSGIGPATLEEIRTRATV